MHAELKDLQGSFRRPIEELDEYWLEFGRGFRVVENESHEIYEQTNEVEALAIAAVGAVGEGFRLVDAARVQPLALIVGR